MKVLKTYPLLAIGLFGCIVTQTQAVLYAQQKGLTLERSRRKRVQLPSP